MYKSLVPCLVLTPLSSLLYYIKVAGTNAAHGEAGVKFTDASRKRLGLPEEKWCVAMVNQRLVDSIEMVD